MFDLNPGELGTAIVFMAIILVELVFFFLAGESRSPDIKKSLK